jgi:hypothetical protein
MKKNSNQRIMGTKIRGETHIPGNLPSSVSLIIYSSSRVRLSLDINRDDGDQEEEKANVVLYSVSNFKFNNYQNCFGVLRPRLKEKTKEKN